MSDYRVTIKVRNGRLLRAINNAGYQSIPKFCEACGVCYSRVNGLLNMTESPLDRSGNVRPFVESIMEFLCEPFEVLFSEAQCQALETNKTERDVSAEQVFALMSNEAPCMYEQIETDDRKALLAEALDQLTPREKRVLELRFFENMTLQRSADALGVSSREYVRQIEAVALRKMRHPKLGDKLARLCGYKDEAAA